MFCRAIPPAAFARRRRELMDRMGPGSIALLPAAPSVPRNRDVHYPYRQDSDFYYLTGFPEPEAVAVLAPGGEHEFLLFCRERDPQMEIWRDQKARWTATGRTTPIPSPKSTSGCPRCWKTASECFTPSATARTSTGE